MRGTQYEKCLGDASNASRAALAVFRPVVNYMEHLAEPHTAFFQKGALAGTSLKGNFCGSS